MGEKGRRSMCPKCGSMNVIKWGPQCGCQRFKCKDSNTSFISKRPDVSLA